MKQNTLVLFGLLLLAIIGALVWFQTHQYQLNMAVIHGGMSQEMRQKWLSQGVDCQETYELQGYEGPETVLRMFSLSQHEFYSLNPGQTMEFQAGMVICVKGLWGLSNTGPPMIWFWPAVAVAAAAVGFLASSLLAQFKAAQVQGKGHGMGPPAASSAAASDACAA